MFISSANEPFAANSSAAWSWNNRMVPYNQAMIVANYLHNVELIHTSRPLIRAIISPLLAARRQTLDKRMSQVIACSWN